VTTPDTNPSTLRWAVGLLFAEAAALTLVTAYLVVQDLTGKATDVGVAIGVTLFAALAVVVLVAVARSLNRRRSGARGPAVVLQLMLLVLGYYMIQGGLVWLGVLLIVVGLAAGLLIVSPPTTRALGLG
jgi:peptidoglycan/LPS O-acetylase OafA/YrhL